tara:strand:- start:2092 stop:4944 length:2853 start_codon:yes stop_codon:yes gene_type:complete
MSNVKIDNCGVVTLTTTQENYFDKALEFKNKFNHLVDADALAFQQFRRIFHTDMTNMAHISDVELSNNWHLFEKKMDVLANQIETGKISSKMGRVLWTTQELAERNPIMANVYDSFVNTGLNYKGRVLKSEAQFKNILNHLKVESIQNQMYNDLTKKKYPLGRKEMDRVVKEAQEFQERLEELQIDAENKVPGAAAEYKAHFKRMEDFLVNGEGKIFNDFVNIIEIGLPKLGKEVDKFYKEKFELQERNRNKVWTGVERAKLLKGIKNRLANLTIPVKEIINGKEVITEMPISGNMQAALSSYIDYTTNLHKYLTDGVKAYVDGAELSIKDQFSGLQLKSRMDKIKNIKKNMVKTLNPDYKIGYFPHFRLDMGVKFLDNLMPNADNLAMKTLENVSWSKKGVDEALKDLDGYISNRLKARDEDVDPMLYSRNFPAVMKRYAGEVNRFNNVAFVQKYTKEALTNIKKIYRKGKQLDGISQYFVEMVEDMNHAMIGKRDIDDPFWESARQSLLGLEYMSKLGWNFRTATKNATQGILNWVFLNDMGFFGKSKDFYERKGVDFSNKVELMMEEAGLSFSSGTPELQEVMGSTSSRQIVKLSEGYSVEFKKPSYAQKTARNVANFAGKGEKPWHPSFFMQKVENSNRMRTFKIAFAKMYSELEGSTQFRSLVSSQGKDFNQELQSRARNYAIRMTNMLHFDYSDVSKSKLLRHPLGRFMFQFQHYSQKFFELNKKALYDDLKLAKAKQDIFAEEVGTAVRLGAAYTIVPGIISLMFDVNAFNLIEHATFDKGSSLFAFFTGNEKEIKDASFGRGAVGMVGFPLLSDLLTLGELSNLYEHDEDSWVNLLTGYESYRSQDEELKTMAIIGLINTQLKRTVGQTWPLFRDGSIGTAFQFEAGLYKNKKVKEMNEAFYRTARAVAPDLAEYYEDTQSKYNDFVSKYKSQQHKRYYRGY